MRADTPDHPSAALVQEYLEQYADHYQLRPHFRLGVSIMSVRRSSGNTSWIVSSKELDSVLKDEEFDKVVVTTGTFHSPLIPQIPGIEKFKGDVLHSQSFKESAYPSL